MSRTSSRPSLFPVFLRAIIIASALHLALSISHAFYLNYTPFLPGLSSSNVTASGFQILTHTSVAPATTLILSSLEYFTAQRAAHSRAYALFVSTTMFLGWIVSWLDWTACRGDWCRPAPSPANDFYGFIVCFAWWAGGLVIALAYAACGFAGMAAMLGLRGEGSVSGVEAAWMSDETESLGGAAIRGGETCGETCGETEALGRAGDSARADVPVTTLTPEP